MKTIILSADLPSQRNRLLQRLRSGPATTLELRCELDILMPAARIYELRHNAGHNIILDWVYVDTDLGTHRVGRYVLQSGKWRGNYEN